MFYRSLVRPKDNPFILLFLFLFIAASFLLSVQPAQSAQVTLAWSASSDAAVTGYKLYWGTQSQQYEPLADVGNSTSETVADLQSGTTYYFVATAYDASGSESVYSNEVSYTPAADCTYAVTPSSSTFTAAGGTGTLNVTTQPTCAWTASSGSSWLAITSGATGTGSGTVTYSVSANTATSSRMIAATVAGQTFTVTQAGIQAYTITASAGTGGTITPSGTTTVNAGASQSYTIAANSGYGISNVTVDGASIGAVNSYTFSNVTGNHTIAATFTLDTYNLSVTTSGNGTVTTNPGGTTFPAGTSVTLTATPASGSTFTGWSGACTDTSPTCTVTMNSDVSVGASFVMTPTEAYTITASAGSGGSVSPAGTSTVAAGGTITYTITPTRGYAVSSVKVDGVLKGQLTSYTFSNVTANHKIQAFFAKIKVR